MLEKTLESPLNIKEIKPANLRVNQPWILFGRGFSGGSVVKHLPAKQESRVRSLGQEDPLKKEMATHSSILPEKITWTGEPGKLYSVRSQTVRHGEWLSTHAQVLIRHVCCAEQQPMCYDNTIFQFSWRLSDKSVYFWALLGSKCFPRCLGSHSKQLILVQKENLIYREVLYIFLSWDTLLF